MRLSVLIILLIVVFSIVTLPLFHVQAQEESLVPCGTRDNPTACELCHIFVLISNVFSFVITRIIPSLVVIGTIWGGYVFLTAGGNQEKVKAGRKILINTFVGLLIAYGAFLIAGTVVGQISTNSGASFGFSPGGITINCPVR